MVPQRYRAEAIPLAGAPPVQTADWGYQRDGEPEASAPEPAFEYHPQERIPPIDPSSAGYPGLRPPEGAPSHAYSLVLSLNRRPQ